MKFIKMHGIGNDYVYVNCFEEHVDNPEQLSILVSDRRKGIGADGLILILPSDKADCRMRIFNADGSEAMMCGNGIRCVGKYAYDHGIVTKPELSVETNSGIKHIQLQIQDHKAIGATVDMGKAILKPELIPMIPEYAKNSENPEISENWNPENFIRQELSVAGQTYLVTAVSMGNPHCVIFLEDDVQTLDLETIGSLFEFHKAFPERVNTEFVNVLNDHTVKMRVWERGSGETMACGTGACAVAVASVLNGYCRQEQPITVKLFGGDLQIVYHTDQTVTMTGSATEVFTG
ncbi:MAG: diaminopimelate epimerase, partial [Oscillospiraceae bacterium]|nr:diaminopimelate epimerase [Oscillospiraceae bacterium]